MMTLEPIPSLSAVLMALKSVHLPDEALGRDVATLDQRVRATRSADASAWPAIYREVIALLPRVLQATEAAAAARDQARSARETRERTARIASEAQSLVQKELAEWPSRLARQEKELADKAGRAIEKLALSSTDNLATGETVHAFEEQSLEGWRRWLQQAAQGWAANNQELVAKRANETLERGGIDIKELPSFKVAPAAIAAPNASLPKLKGYPVPTVGLLDSLGRTYKTVIAGFGSVSMLGFAVTRIAGNSPFVHDVLPWFFGLGLVATAVFVLATYPKQKSQAQARVQAKAREHLDREAREAVRAWLKELAEAQMQAIRKHLSNESLRLKTQGKETPSPSSFEPVQDTIPPATLERLRGEWRIALDAHLRELEQPR